jgi:hypothetical protein
MSQHFQQPMSKQWFEGSWASSQQSSLPPNRLRMSDSCVQYHAVSDDVNANSANNGYNDILTKIRSNNLWIVNGRRRNGVIIHKEFYTEFAGPGAAIGGGLDADCKAVIPLGSLSLIAPKSAEEQQKALRIRLQWVRLTQNFTDKPVPVERAQMILEQFKSYFDQEIVDQVPDEAFALLVGVLPYTIRKARALV